MKAGRAVRQARRRMGLTQRELARRARVAQSTIARIESGVTDPAVSLVDRLLRLCGDELQAAPRLGVGVDRTVIREELRRTPRQRIEDSQVAADGLERLRSARRVS